jgi:hypothetical protein
MKEVAQVEITNIQRAASTPSSLGMPICGHAFATAFAGADTTSVVRDRQAALKGDMGLAVAYVPGPQAWSPPTS